MTNLEYWFFDASFNPMIPSSIIPDLKKERYPSFSPIRHDFFQNTPFGTWALITPATWSSVISIDARAGNYA